jgi:hypothetical protein
MATANANAAIGISREANAYPRKAMGNTNAKEIARAIQDQSTACLRMLANLF